MSALRNSLVVVALVGLAGCKKDEAAAVPVPVAPPAAANQAAAPAGDLVGTVVERLDAPNYTYLRINGPGGDTWAAVPTTQVAVGTRVSIANPMPMQKFESKTLGRTFDLVMFGGGTQVLGGEGGGAAAAAPTGDPHQGVPPGPAAAPVDLANIQVPKATGADAHTIAEVFAQRTELKDKSSTVRGKVVKVTSGVLGRNWLHLRDGSGTDAAQDNDLIVTTTSVVQVNDVITAQGTVRTDKDLGSGYAYKVLIEDATVTK